MLEKAEEEVGPDEFEEVVNVSLSDTTPDPRTVVIEHRDTPIAESAVLGSCGLREVACLALVFPLESHFVVKSVELLHAFLVVFGGQGSRVRLPGLVVEVEGQKSEGIHEQVDGKRNYVVVIDVDALQVKEVGHWTYCEIKNLDHWIFFVHYVVYQGTRILS